MKKHLFCFLLFAAAVAGGCSSQGQQDRTANEQQPTAENKIVQAEPASAQAEPSAEPTTRPASKPIEIVPPTQKRKATSRYTNRYANTPGGETAKPEPAKTEPLQPLTESPPPTAAPRKIEQPSVVTNPLRARRLSPANSFRPRAKKLAPSPRITASRKMASRETAPLETAPLKTTAKALRIRRDPLPIQDKSSSIAAKSAPLLTSKQTTRSAKLSAPLLAESAAVAPLAAPEKMTAQPKVMMSKPLAITARGAEDPSFTIVKVFYGTDRLADNALDGQFQLLTRQFFPAGGAAILTLLLGVATIFSSRHKLMASLTVVSLAAAITLGYFATFKAARIQLATAQNQPIYGNGRGALELGVCEVSIPKNHQVGEVESPSILRLEIREDAEKHIVLRSIQRRAEGAFYEELRSAVQQSDNREVLVFIHGYNVAFDDAARRTAQIAYDLHFQGAPILYSWPSQAGLLQYTIDETNVVWTVPHLKQFLLDVAKKSDAQSINLIAHSMGNRALTSTLRDFSLELQEDARMFNQVVLAAPDIDADVFRNDIAPKIVKTANRVTLYASSNDQALAASKSVHGYPRAGESGAGLVVMADIETIDVTDVDLSLIGHSYIGSNYTLLEDLFGLINNSLPGQQRHTLKPMVRDGLTYFLLRKHLHNAADPSDLDATR